VPLLIETGAYRDLAQRVLVVDCEERAQTTRVMRRDGFTAEQVRNIMSNQASRGERLEHADDIVHNDADLVKLRDDVVALHRKYLTLASSCSNSS
jgi:dephospho-CoA kinase